MEFDSQALRNLLTLGLWEQAEFYVIGTVDDVYVSIKRRGNKTYAYFLSAEKFIGLHVVVE